MGGKILTFVFLKIYTTKCLKTLKHDYMILYSICANCLSQLTPTNVGTNKYFANVSKKLKNWHLFKSLFFVIHSAVANRTMKVTPVGSQRHLDTIDQIL